MAQNKANTVIFTKVGHPIPAMHTFDTHNKIVSVGFNQLVKWLWVGRYFFMQQRVTFVIEDAYVEKSGM